MFVIWFNAEGILLFLKQDPDVAHLAAVYLRWVSLGLPGRFPFSVMLVGLSDMHIKPMLSTASAGMSTSCSLSLFHLLNTPHRRYFQSQGWYNIAMESTLSHSMVIGLFAIPTRIICVVAPLNALLNYTLGIYTPRILSFSFSPRKTGSLGP